MNVSGVTQTAQVLPDTQSAPPPPQAQSVEQATSVGADSVRLSVDIQTQVMDMAQRQFEQAASEIVSQMAASTGVGTNVDMAV